MSVLERIPCCPHGSKDKISVDLVRSLERLETRLGHELRYTSGYRCADCNRKVGGVEHSAHLRGCGVDVSCLSGFERMLLVDNATLLGFRRIGVGKTIVHLDIDLQNPQDVLWVY